MSKNILYFIVAAVILIALGGAAFYFTQRPPKEPQRSTIPIPTEQEQGLGSQLYENPAENVPETNPFEAETNPLKTKTNPFEGGYTNPF